MNERQRRFADFYIELGNVYQAAIKAGYSENYAKAQSHKLLENVGVKAYVDERLEKIKTERVADQQEIMEFLTSVVRGEVVEPVPILDGEGYQKVVEVQPSVQTRRAAAVDLGKRYMMWTERHEVEHKLPTFVDDVDE